ncbi:hypothetical protein GJ496_008736 [Pomphorhynchus laevis]|nr:hypothetical protein GJ496_008736 [Pomphorhynchus laevis]
MLENFNIITPSIDSKEKPSITIYNKDIIESIVGPSPTNNASILPKEDTYRRMRKDESCFNLKSDKNILSNLNISLEKCFLRNDLLSSSSTSTVPGKEEGPCDCLNEQTRLIPTIVDKLFCNNSYNSSPKQKFRFAAKWDSSRCKYFKTTPVSPVSSTNLKPGEQSEGNSDYQVCVSPLMSSSKENFKRDSSSAYTNIGDKIFADIPYNADKGTKNSAMQQWCNDKTANICLPCDSDLTDKPESITTKLASNSAELILKRNSKHSSNSKNISTLNDYNFPGDDEVLRREASSQIGQTSTYASQWVDCVSAMKSSGDVADLVMAPQKNIEMQDDFFSDLYSCSCNISCKKVDCSFCCCIENVDEANLPIVKNFQAKETEQLQRTEHENKRICWMINQSDDSFDDYDRRSTATVESFSNGLPPICKHYVNDDSKFFILNDEHIDDCDADINDDAFISNCKIETEFGKNKFISTTVKEIESSNFLSVLNNKQDRQFHDEPLDQYSDKEESTKDCHSSSSLSRSKSEYDNTTIVVNGYPAETSNHDDCCGYSSKNSSNGKQLPISKHSLRAKAMNMGICRHSSSINSNSRANIEASCSTSDNDSDVNSGKDRSERQIITKAVDDSKKGQQTSEWLSSSKQYSYNTDDYISRHMTDKYIEHQQSDHSDHAQYVDANYSDQDGSSKDGSDIVMLDEDISLAANEFCKKDTNELRDETQEDKHCHLIEDVIERFLSSKFISKNCHPQHKSDDTYYSHNEQIVDDYNSKEEAIKRLVISPPSSLESQETSHQQLSDVYNELAKFRPHSLSTIPSSDGYQDITENEETNCKSQCSSDHRSSREDFRSSDDSLTNDVFLISGGCCYKKVPWPSKIDNKDKIDKMSTCANEMMHSITSGIDSAGETSACTTTANRQETAIQHKRGDEEENSQSEKISSQLNSCNELNKSSRAMRVDCEDIQLDLSSWNYESKHDGTIGGKLPNSIDWVYNQSIQNTYKQILNTAKEAGNDAVWRAGETIKREDNSKIQALSISKSAAIFCDGKCFSRVDMSCESNEKQQQFSYTQSCFICKEKRRTVSDVISIDIEPHDSSMAIVFEPTFMDQGKGFYIPLHYNSNDRINNCNHTMSSMRRQVNRRRCNENRWRPKFSYPLKKSVCSRSCSIQCTLKTDINCHNRNDMYCERDLSQHQNQIRLLDQHFVISSLRLDADRTRLLAEHANAKLQIMLEESEHILDDITATSKNDKEVEMLKNYKRNLVNNIGEIERTMYYLIPTADDNNSFRSYEDTVDKMLMANSDIDYTQYDNNANHTAVLNDINVLLADLRTLHEESALQIELARETLKQK